MTIQSLNQRGISVEDKIGVSQRFKMTALTIVASGRNAGKHSLRFLRNENPESVRI